MKPSRRKRLNAAPKVSQTLEAKYTRYIVRLLRVLQSELIEALQPSFESEFRRDALGPKAQSAFGILELRFNQLLKDDEITDEARRVGKVVTRNNKQKLSRIISITTADAGLEDEAMKAFIQRNTNLIKSLGSEQIQRTKTIVEEAFIRGERVELVTKQLQSEFGVMKSRARLIARDQLGKLNGQMTQTRHKAAGIDQYVWTTVGDERVRDTHDLLEGQTFSWDSPPPDTGHPGDDYQCRCFAYPIL